MVALTYIAVVVGLIGTAIADSTLPPACAGTNADSIVASSKSHLLCDDLGAEAGKPGIKRYSCQPENSKTTFDAEVLVKTTDPNIKLQVDNVIFTNKMAANKVYALTSASPDGTNKKTFYYTLQGQNMCSVQGEFATQIGAFDPTAVYVYDKKH